MFARKFKIIGKPILGKKYVEGRRKKEEKERKRIMPSLVATTSALARTTCMHMRYVHTKI